MKRILKKGLISILIVLIVFNFMSASVTNVSYGLDIDLGDIFSGLIGVITWVPRALMMAALMGLNKLITAFAMFGTGGVEGYDAIDVLGFTKDSYITPFHIFFNKIALLDVNFLNIAAAEEGSTVATFRTAVAGWYYTMRLIACMVLAVILIYIGIRMAISTIASEKAMYKKMLVDWVTSLALLFLLHYIMLFTFACNEALVNAIAKVCESQNLDAIMLKLNAEAFGIQIIEAVAAMILFGIIIGQTLAFLFAYVKRMITIGFLIMIAPLITITYSIDKIGDGKAQALNTWLKEFVYNVLIQPFHCILFAAFAGVAYTLIQDPDTLFSAGDTSIPAMILAICCIQFIKTGEELVKKIFGFGQASSLTTMATGAAMTMAAMSKGGEVGKAVGAGAAKARNFVANNKQLNQVAGHLSKNVRSATGNLTSRVKTLTGQAEKFQRNKDGTIKRDERTGEALLTAAGKAELARKESMNYARMENASTKEENDAQHAQARTQALESMIKKDENKQARFTAKQQKLSEKREKKEKKEAYKKERYESKYGKGTYEDRPTIKGFAKSVGGSAVGFVKDNKEQLKSMSVGAVVGMIGMGAGGMQGAVIGSKIGTGYYQGYMANTDKTLEKNYSAMAMAMNIVNKDTPNFDIEKATYEALASAQNGQFEKLSEQLDQILDKVSGLGDHKSEFKADFSKKLIENPAGLTDSFLKSLMTNYQIKPENQDSVLAGMQEYRKLAVTAKFANAVLEGTNTRGIGDIAAAVKKVTINNEMHQHNNYTEYRTEEEDTASGRPEPSVSSGPRVSPEAQRAFDAARRSGMEDVQDESDNLGDQS